MVRCALVLRHGLIDWPIKRQYDRVAGYCHVKKLEIRKIYIDPSDLSMAEIRHDALELDFELLIVADRSIAKGFLPPIENWGSLRDDDSVELVAVGG